MSIHEYAAWDGSQDPTGSKSESVFDKLAEYMMSMGDEIWQRIDQSDEDTKEILDLIRQEGLIEKDEHGHYQVSAKGLRRNAPSSPGWTAPARRRLPGWRCLRGTRSGCAAKSCARTGRNRSAAKSGARWPTVPPSVRRLRMNCSPARRRGSSAGAEGLRRSL